jgi:hypothetical protein
MAELFPQQNKISFPQTLAAAQKFPVIGNRIFATLANAQEYVDKVKGSAIPGIILSVIADGDNNGAYWVSQAAGYDGATVGVLQKLERGGGTSGGGGDVSFSIASNTTNAVSLTVNSETKNITVATMKSSLGLKALAYEESVVKALGYTPLDQDDFTKAKLGLDNVTNLAASNYLTALSANTNNAVSITVGGTTKTIGVADMRNALGLAGLAYLASVPDALGYTPFDKANFTKENIKSTLEIADWALASSGPSKSDVGLGNVDNIAAKDYFTALTSGTTNAVSMTIGGVTKDITASTLKSSLGLKSLAYEDSLAFSDLTSHPTTLSGYGITDALGSGGTAVAAEKLSDSSAFTIWGNTFFTGGKPKSVTGDLTLASGRVLKIGDATISWDSANQMLKIDKGIYSTGSITAKKQA